MTKRELIDALEANELPDYAEVVIAWNWFLKPIDGVPEVKDDKIVLHPGE